MLLKGILIYSSGIPFVSEEQNQLCNFGRVQYVEYFFDIILNSDQWFRRCFKIFLIYSSGGPLVWCSRTICAILVDGNIGNIPVKLLGI